MKYANRIGAVAAILMIATAFMPWLFIESKQITVTGLHTEGTGFGKPAYMNIFFSAIALVLFLMPTVWAKRFNFFFCGANLAWAARNYLILTVCFAGECPVRKYGLFLSLIAGAIMLVMALFPEMKLPGEPKKDSTN